MGLKISGGGWMGNRIWRLGQVAWSSDKNAAIKACKDIIKETEHEEIREQAEERLANLLQERD